MTKKSLMPLQEQALCLIYQEGLSEKEAAKQMNISRQAISKLLVGVETSKRLITKKQERALQLCHQDFEGLFQPEAAKQMGISHQAINRLLMSVKKVLPQYFPIITKHEAKIYHYYMVEGWKVDEIIEYTELSENAIYKTLQRAKAKGMFFAGAKGRILSYDASMDDEKEGMGAQVKYKF